jgi:hypothetical protein
VDKQNDPLMINKFKIMRPKKISRFIVKTPHLIEAIIAYLFLLK